MKHGCFQTIAPSPLQEFLKFADKTFVGEKGCFMSMLARFRKPGGFSQLLLLIETCEPSKKNNLIQMVGAEDPGWAHLISVKALTLDRILSWPVEILMEITTQLPDLVLVAVYQYADHRQAQIPSAHEKWLAALPRMKAKEVQDLCFIHQPEASEQQSAATKVIQVVRELEGKGTLKLALIDPSVEIDKRLTA